MPIKIISSEARKHELAPFNRLPIELVEKVGSNLSLADNLVFSQVNHSARRAARKQLLLKPPETVFMADVDHRPELLCMFDERLGPYNPQRRRIMAFNWFGCKNHPVIANLQTALLASPPVNQQNSIFWLYRAGAPASAAILALDFAVNQRDSVFKTKIPVCVSEYQDDRLCQSVDHSMNWYKDMVLIPDQAARLLRSLHERTYAEWFIRPLGLFGSAEQLSMLDENWPLRSASTLVRSIATRRTDFFSCLEAVPRTLKALASDAVSQYDHWLWHDIAKNENGRTNLLFLAQKLETLDVQPKFRISTMIEVRLIRMTYSPTDSGLHLLFDALHPQAVTTVAQFIFDRFTTPQTFTEYATDYNLIRVLKEILRCARAQEIFFEYFLICAHDSRTSHLIDRSKSKDVICIDKDFFQKQKIFDERFNIFVSKLTQHETIIHAYKQAIMRLLQPTDYSTFEKHLC